MNKLIDKILESDARILNPSFETLEKMGRIGLALAATGIIAVVVALVTM